MNQYGGQSRLCVGNYAFALFVCSKTSTKTDVLPDGTVVPKGVQIIFYPYLMGRDAQRYPEVRTRVPGYCEFGKYPVIASGQADEDSRKGKSQDDAYHDVMCQYGKFSLNGI